MLKKDGIHSMLTNEAMVPMARKIRDIYNKKPNAPFYQKEFGFYCLERWIKEGKISQEEVDTGELNRKFEYDDQGIYGLGGLGWCEPAFLPLFEEKVLEDRGEHEVVQDYAGRHVLYFKGRRNGFMPEYLDHPVKDRASWESLCKWRLNPQTEERYRDMDIKMQPAIEAAQKGLMISQHVIGGYMYLRALMGPEPLLYMFYDDPGLIHECMETWFQLADAVIAQHQQYVTLDELFLAEDICYKQGSLISPDMMREFLFPYYKRLIKNIKARQIDQQRHLYIQIDTDGNCEPVIPVYQEIGMDVMSPFEVASGCNVVEISKKYPDLIMFGGIDKRILAQGEKEIDEHIDAILPDMKVRGGYIPTCDHGVPEEVSYENYCYFRKKCLVFNQ